MHFMRIESTIGLILEILVLYSGVLVWLYSNTIITLEKYFSFGPEYQVVRGTVFILIVSMFSTLIKIPFEIYRLLHIDASYQSQYASDYVKYWIFDQLKAFVFSLALGIPIIGTTLAILVWNVRFQWVLTCLFVSGIAVFFSDVYGDLLAPFFDTMLPLCNHPDTTDQGKREKELEQQIRNLSLKVKFPLEEILKIDSSHGAHSNAFLIGFGAKKRSIVLCENLITDLSIPEIIAIIGHEIGHYKSKHLYKKLFVQLCLVGNFIFLFSHVIKMPDFYNSFGFDQIDASIGIILFSYLYTSFASLMRIVTNYFSRSFEYSADEYAIDNELEMEMALIKIHAMNISNIMPDKLYSIYHYSHPSLMERLEKMKKIEGKFEKR